MSTTFEETYNGVPLSELFPEEQPGWRGYAPDFSSGLIVR